MSTYRSRELAPDAVLRRLALEAAQEEVERELRRVMETCLTPVEAEVLRLRCVEEWSVERTAAYLNLLPQVVSRLERGALDVLREELG